tara:strand:+ start:83 stop:205 length:123 start_codon:yes stop_codon:yes gene_type:complete
VVEEELGQMEVHVEQEILEDQVVEECMMEVKQEVLVTLLP